MSPATISRLYSEVLNKNTDTSFTQKRAIKYSVMIEDVDAAIQQQLQRKDLTGDTGNPTLRLDEYHTLDEVMIPCVLTNG